MFWQAKLPSRTLPCVLPTEVFKPAPHKSVAALPQMYRTSALLVVWGWRPMTTFSLHEFLFILHPASHPSSWYRETLVSGTWVRHFGKITPHWLWGGSLGPNNPSKRLSLLNAQTMRLFFTILMWQIFCESYLCSLIMDYPLLFFRVASQGCQGPLS